MLGRFVNRPSENSREPAPTAKADAAAPDTAPQQDADAKPKTVSCIGAGMSITGNVVCDGAMQVFGRIEGHVRAVEIEIGDGAELEGNVVAQELTVRGHVKGTIRAVRVRLQGNGTVDGDIFHRSLSIEEHARFEGNSRRIENPLDATITETRAASAPLRNVFRPNLAAIGEVSPGTSAA